MAHLRPAKPRDGSTHARACAWGSCELAFRARRTTLPSPPVIALRTAGGLDEARALVYRPGQVGIRHRQAARMVVGIGASLATWAVVSAGNELALSYAAFRRVNDLAWTRTATHQDLRRAAECSLGFPAEPHEAFVLLHSLGTRSSIPAIRARLRWKPSGPFVPCTWGHGREALETLVQLTDEQERAR